MLKHLHALTILSSDTGVWLALAQLAQARGTAAAGDGGSAPAALLLPQSGTAHRDTLCAGNAAGQAWDAASAAGHRHLSRAGFLVEGLCWKERVGRGEDTMGGKVTERLQKKEREEGRDHRAITYRNNVLMCI